MNHTEDLSNNQETKPLKKEGEEEESREGGEKEKERRQIEKLRELASEKFSTIAEKLIQHEKALEIKNSGDPDFDEESILPDNKVESFSKELTENLDEIKKMMPMTAFGLLI